LRGPVANPGGTYARDEVRNDPGTVISDHVTGA
jgi:hypothetical protein